MEKKLTLGIPSGSLFQPTIELLRKAGVNIENSDKRKFLLKTNGDNIFKEIFITRPDRLPRILIERKINAALVGLDFLIESGLEKEVIEIAKLNYAKTSKNNVKIVIFSKLDEIVDGSHIKVLSEYPSMTKRIFKKSNIISSSGTTEADVAFGLYDYGVGVVETGKSLESNGLKALKTILVSPVVFITLEKTKEVNEFGKILKKVSKGDN